MIKAKLAGDREMLVLNDDEGISEELLLKGHHEPMCTAMMKRVVFYGSNVIEIGANIGYYALIEAVLVGKEGYVYAIEPVPRNIECLKANIKEYGIKNIKTYQVAIGFENTFKLMRLAKFSNSGTLMENDDEKVSQGYKDWFNGWFTEDIVVEQWNLDDFRDVNQIPVPELIRMDVEGYEIEAISGAQKTLHEMLRGSSLFIELHPVVFNDKFDVMYGLLENLYSHGFRPKWCEGEEAFPRQLKTFTRYVCREEVHCPHVFFEKK